MPCESQGTPGVRSRVFHTPSVVFILPSAFPSLDPWCYRAANPTLLSPSANSDEVGELKRRVKKLEEAVAALQAVSARGRSVVRSVGRSFGGSVGRSSVPGVLAFLFVDLVFSPFLFFFLFCGFRCVERFFFVKRVLHVSGSVERGCLFFLYGGGQAAGGL